MTQPSHPDAATPQHTPELAYWLVWSHEHNAWWRPKGCGYTVRVDGAGRFTKDEARQHCLSRSPRKFEDCPPPEVAVIAPEFADTHAQLTAELGVAQGFHKVAVQQRDRAWREIEGLTADLAACRKALEELIGKNENLTSWLMAQNYTFTAGQLRAETNKARACLAPREGKE